MLRVFLTVPAIFFGLSDGAQFSTECYGRSFTMPSYYSASLDKGPLYFSPIDGGPRRVLIENGEVKDPRIQVSGSSVILTHLTEKDNGRFGVLGAGDRVYYIATLEIEDCADERNVQYGNEVRYKFNTKVEFLEFTPQHSLDQPVILWNRTDAGTRGHVKNNVWVMSRATQADKGYYNFRRKDKYLVSRLHLEVEEVHSHYEGVPHTVLRIDYPWTGGEWTVTYKSMETQHSEIVIKNGNKVWREHTFSGRIHVFEDHFEIDPLEGTDDGTFEFRDPQGNLALVALLSMIPDEDASGIASIVAVAIGVLLMGIICCCCCKKKCCKKDKPTSQTEAAPNVYYHSPDHPSGTASPAAPVPPYSSVFARMPVNTAAPSEPTDHSPLTYQPVNVNVNPPQAESTNQSQFAALAPAPTFGLDLLSSDSEPRFELKGLNFPSAPPLSSDTPSCNVYNSDKLNFL
ncbi:uncharacterized protein LOC133446957 isoform X1 [Cololabis saira]|uniref:uncharacterized protein LOC133446957 isoform X1 n=1 Tax=Cololabis saira TaxID=129043 RepID=UPI002AD20A26|nr:uncharacterized protein LOC133446957 isoform X1 [Cololabis saira]